MEILYYAQLVLTFIKFMAATIIVFSLYGGALLGFVAAGMSTEPRPRLVWSTLAIACISGITWLALG